MADVKLATPVLDVTLDDDRVLRTRALNADYIRWDRTSSKHGWAPTAKIPFTFLTFIAWSALRREGQIPDDWTWEEFSEERCLQVKPVPDAEGANGLATVDPTLLALVHE